MRVFLDTNVLACALGTRGLCADVLQLVIKAGGRLVVAGLVLGIVGGFGAARFLRSQLFEVTSLDPISLLVVVVLLGVVGFAACYLPARRATKVDPLVALRYE